MRDIEEKVSSSFGRGGNGIVTYCTITYQAPDWGREGFRPFGLNLRYQFLSGINTLLLVYSVVVLLYINKCTSRALGQLGHTLGPNRH